MKEDFADFLPFKKLRGSEIDLILRLTTESLKHTAPIRAEDIEARKLRKEIAIRAKTLQAVNRKRSPAVGMDYVIETRSGDRRAYSSEKSRSLLQDKLGRRIRQISNDREAKGAESGSNEVSIRSLLRKLSPEPKQNIELIMRQKKLERTKLKEKLESIREINDSVRQKSNMISDMFKNKRDGQGVAGSSTGQAQNPSKKLFFKKNKTNDNSEQAPSPQSNSRSRGGMFKERMWDFDTSSKSSDSSSVKYRRMPKIFIAGGYSITQQKVQHLKELFLKLSGGQPSISLDCKSVQ